MTENKNRFNYMMLSRLQQDCKYFLGNGMRNEKSLWGLNVVDHIQEMKDLHNGFKKDEKPEWLTFQDILEYEEKMKEDYKKV